MCWECPPAGWQRGHARSCSPARVWRGRLPVQLLQVGLRRRLVAAEEARGEEGAQPLLDGLELGVGRRQPPRRLRRAGPSGVVRRRRGAAEVRLGLYPIVTFEKQPPNMIGKLVNVVVLY